MAILEFIDYEKIKQPKGKAKKEEKTGEERKSIMSDILIGLAVIAVWIILQTVVLPRFGVST